MEGVGSTLFVNDRVPCETVNDAVSAADVDVERLALSLFCGDNERDVDDAFRDLVRVPLRAGVSVGSQVSDAERVQVSDLVSAVGVRTMLTVGVAEVDCSREGLSERVACSQRGR